MKKRLAWQLPFLVLLIVGTILIIRQQQNMPYRKCSGSIFGTIYHITYQHDKDLQKQFVAKMKEVDNALSMFNEKSTISRINRNEQVQLDKMFIDVFRQAQEVSADTYGAFDITVGPLVNAWGFGFKHSQMPTPQQVDSLRQLVGYNKVQLSIVNASPHSQGENSQFSIKKSDPRITLDCSAIAKGYAVDQLAHLLEENGVTNYLVEIGGEIATKGVSEKRLPWKIGVTKPTDSLDVDGGEYQTIINVTDKCMATSGNYRNFYYKNGKRYAHTIDPKTGYPVQHTILSATVLCDRCSRADAYATSFMVMGLDSAKSVLQRNPDLKVYFIYYDHGENKVWTSISD
jgi:thiamine biosynthesis lipoprotein